MAFQCAERRRKVSGRILKSGNHLGVVFDNRGELHMVLLVGKVP